MRRVDDEAEERWKGLEGPGMNSARLRIMVWGVQTFNSCSNFLRKQALQAQPKPKKRTHVVPQPEKLRSLETFHDKEDAANEMLNQNTRKEIRTGNLTYRNLPTTQPSLIEAPGHL